MIVDDFLSAATTAIETGDFQAASEYGDAALEALRLVQIAAQSAACLQSMEAAETARRLCIFAETSGRGTLETRNFIAALEGAPRLDKRQSLTSEHNCRAIAWHTRNRAELATLLKAAIARAEAGRHPLH